MTVRFVLLFAAALTLFVCVAMATADADAGAGRQAGSPARPAPARAAEYVGADTCLGCHEDMNRGISRTLHGKAAHPRSPAAAQGCESCHGPGSRHVKDLADPTTIRRFDRIQPRDASAACLSCHTRSPHTMWVGSAHDARNLSCTSCHSMHEPRSESGQLRAATQTELCETCHRVHAHTGSVRLMYTW